MCVGTKALGITVPEFRYWQHHYLMKEYKERKRSETRNAKKNCPLQLKHLRNRKRKRRDPKLP
ncbi:unnamed protein product [Ixodes persulcatus]